MRIPILPTIIVVAAVATMIGLGIWQLERKEWKEALIAEARQADAPPARDFDDPDKPFLKSGKSRFTCTLAEPADVRAGQNRNGETGYSYVVPCQQGITHSPGLSSIRTMPVNIGWSKNPAVDLPMGLTRRFTGTAYEDSERGLMLIADPAVAPLEPSKVPSPAELPNNHLLYAIQWFFFALAAAVIYVLALRRRQRR